MAPSQRYVEGAVVEFWSKVAINDPGCARIPTLISVCHIGDYSLGTWKPQPLCCQIAFRPSCSRHRASTTNEIIILRASQLIDCIQHGRSSILIWLPWLI